MKLSNVFVSTRQRLFNSVSLFTSSIPLAVISVRWFATLIMTGSIVFLRLILRPTVYSTEGCEAVCVGLSAGTNPPPPARQTNAFGH